MRAVEAGVESGQLREDVDYPAVSRQVIAMLEGLENQWLIDPPDVDIVRLFHGYPSQVRAAVTA